MHRRGPRSFTSFVEVASYIAGRAGADGKVAYRVGDIAALPFEPDTFDLVWTEHVLMNLTDRSMAYAGFHRVLKPAGKLAFYEPIAVEEGEAPHYPTPWAEPAEQSHLLTERETVEALKQASFVVSDWRDVSSEAAASFAGMPPPTPGPLRLGMVMGTRYPAMAMNFARNINEGRVRIVMGVCVKTS